MAHMQTTSDEKLAYGDVITVLVIGVPRVFAHRGGRAFAAVKGDGSVVTWVQAECGGHSDGVSTELSGGVEHVVGTSRASAAMTDDGTVVTWWYGLTDANQRWSSLN